MDNIGDTIWYHEDILYTEHYISKHFPRTCSIDSFFAKGWLVFMTPPPWHDLRRKVVSSNYLIMCVWVHVWVRFFDLEKPNEKTLAEGSGNDGGMGLDLPVTR